MALTVDSLLAELDLELAAGAGGAGRPIRWVHLSELEDPTPWLSGGELLLTTGLNLTTAERQRRFVRRLAERGLAGIGFGTGFDHAELPAALLTEAELCELPLFEVPYETPFIAITERAFTTLVNEQYAVLARGIEIHERLEGLVLAGGSVEEVLRATAEAVGGAALLVDERGQELARHPQERSVSASASRAIGEQVSERVAAGRRSLFVPEGPLADRAVALPVPIEEPGASGSWLVVARRTGVAGDLERLIARAAAMVVALAMMRERVVRETERRLAGDVLAAALAGRLGADELSGRLAPFGIGEQATVLLYEGPEGPEAEATLEVALAAAGVPALVAINTAAGRPLLCAIVDPGGRDPVEIARQGREALAAGQSRTVRAAASRALSTGSLRRAFHEARCALEATALANGRRPEVASHGDLGAFTLLLSLQDDEALRTYADNLLAPIEDGEGGYGPELLRSLEAFIERNGQWERAARDLYCHRHTLRYRIRRIEELTGRDLSRAQDRIELWLALRARELVR